VRAVVVVISIFVVIIIRRSRYHSQHLFTITVTVTTSITSLTTLLCVSNRTCVHIKWAGRALAKVLAISPTTPRYGLALCRIRSSELAGRALLKPNRERRSYRHELHARYYCPSALFLRI
jgi:hypothetical protein